MSGKEISMAQTGKSLVKAAARETLESLPDDATWDDVIYRMYVRQKIEAGLADAEAGDFVSTDEVRRRLGRLDES
jgi:predicted transcriptional regulator